MLGNFGVFFVLAILNLARFLTTCISATSFKFGTFNLAHLHISEMTRTKFFRISSHNIRNVYNKV